MTTSLQLNPIESLRFKVWDQHRRSGLGDDIPRYLVSRCMNAHIRHDPGSDAGYIVFDYDAQADQFRHDMHRVLRRAINPDEEGR